MPSNGPAEKIIYELKGIPLFTYGMIGITTLVLAYITFTDVEKSSDNIENPLNKLNPLLQIPTTLSNDVKDLSKEVSNIYQNTDLSKEASNIYQNNPVSNAVSNIYQNTDLSKAVSNIYQTNPLSKEGQMNQDVGKSEGVGLSEGQRGQGEGEGKGLGEGQRGGKTKTEKQKTKTEKHKMKIEKQKTKTKKQKSNK
jgi:hypothetical protein